MLMKLCDIERMFESEKQIKIPEPEISIKNDSADAKPSQGNAEIGGEGCFANASFAGADQDGACLRRHEPLNSSASLGAVG